MLAAHGQAVADQRLQARVVAFLAEFDTGLSVGHVLLLLSYELPPVRWLSFDPQAIRTKPARRERVPCRLRSDEHTSELQSLMRTSYAVFCLTKKNNKYDTNTT